MVVADWNVARQYHMFVWKITLAVRNRKRAKAEYLRMEEYRDEFDRY